MVYFGKDVDNFSVIRMIRIVGVEMNDKFMVRGVLVYFQFYFDILKGLNCQFILKCVMGMINKYLLLFNMCLLFILIMVYLISGQIIIDINRLGLLNYYY